MKLSNIQKWETLKHLRENAVGIEDGNKTVLILSVNSWGKTERCAFCGRNHYHGAYNGNRVSHCRNDLFNFPIDKNLVFQNRIGQLFFYSDGYALKRESDRGSFLDLYPVGVK